MSKDRRYRDKEWLQQQYLSKKQTSREIAKKCDCAKSTIENWLKKHDIETRGDKRRASDERLTDKKWLRKQYVEKCRTGEDIAEQCDCCAATVLRWVDRHDIETSGNDRLITNDRLADEEWLRGKYVKEGRSTSEIAEECNCSDSTVMRWLDNHGIETDPAQRLAADQRLTDAEWLREQYIEEALSMPEIGEKCGCSASAVYTWLNKHDIETRDFNDTPADERLTDKEWLIEQYNEREKTTEEIASICDCSSSTVTSWLSKHNVETGNQTRFGSDHVLRDREWLYKRYVEEGQSMAEIANGMDFHATSVCRWLDKHNIETRNTKSADDRIKKGDWLQEQYVLKEKTMTEIAELCDCHHTTVSSWLQRHGIEKREQTRKVPDERLENEDWLRKEYVDKFQSASEIAEKCDCHSSTVYRYLNEFGIEGHDCSHSINDKRLTDAEWLKKKYVDEEKDLSHIGEICGCTASTVGRWLKRHNIKTRTRGGWDKYRSNSVLKDKRLANFDWMKKKYEEEGMTCEEIAQKCNCHNTTVSRWLNTHGIDTGQSEHKPLDQRLTDEEWVREQYIKKEMPCSEIADVCDCSASAVQRWVKRHGIETKPGKIQMKDSRLADKDWLREQYKDEERTGYEIADECGCSYSIVYKWLNEHGIEIEYNGGMSGEDHPRWSGGEKNYGSGWNESKRQNVRERDDYNCQDPNCSVTQAEHIDEYGERLHVHHLRKARTVDDPEERNAKENLITLCRSCHKRWEKIADTGLVPQGLALADD